MATTLVERDAPAPVQYADRRPLGGEPIEPIGPCFQPIERQRHCPGSVLHGRRGRSGRASGRQGPARLGRDAGRRAGAGHVPVSRKAGRARRGAGDPGHARARQDPRRIACVGPPRRRGRRIRLRSAQPDHGSVACQHRPPGRLRNDPPPGRRVRGHHSVQFPGDGPALDVPDRDRVRQHVCLEALGKGPPVGGPHGRALDGVGVARGGLQHRARRQRMRRCAPGSPAGAGGLVRRLDGGRPARLRDRHAKRQASPGGRRRQEPS